MAQRGRFELVLGLVVWGTTACVDEAADSHAQPVSVKPTGASEAGSPTTEDAGQVHAQAETSQPAPPSPSREAAEVCRTTCAPLDLMDQNLECIPGDLVVGDRYIAYAGDAGAVPSITLAPRASGDAGSTVASPCEAACGEALAGSAHCVPAFRAYSECTYDAIFYCKLQDGSPTWSSNDCYSQIQEVDTCLTGG
jgi:hypothetical protein